ncbi:MAG: beta-lactamase family protein [Chloroflexi bacterium]|nr:beta-lactamase family protein [Chloroflexota bacterium]
MNELSYFPPSDAAGGWRTLTDPREVRRVAGLDVGKLDQALAVARESTKNGGLLVARRGWLAYERYFGLGCREAAPNTASCGKSFTSIALGILLGERPEAFPEGLEQRVYTTDYLPPEAFPLPDPAKAEIKLGQLLAFTAGIRGNNPGYIRGRETTLDPIGPDGWQAMVDEIALGLSEESYPDGRPFTARTLWCPPGGGYSYATASIHLVSLILRRVAGMEMQAYLAQRLAEPLGWGRWSFAYRNAPRVTHTPGGGGAALRGTDMLRFLYLLLREGRWGDRQVVPAWYVRHARQRSPYNPHFPYSLQFDVNSDGWYPELPRDAYWKAGSGGHALYVVPSLDLVAWKLGGRDEQYSPANTGLPAAQPDEAGPREGWAAAWEPGAALRKVLELVVAAAVD